MLQVSEPYPQALDSLSWQWSLGTCICNKPAGKKQLVNEPQCSELALTLHQITWGLKKMKILRQRLGWDLRFCISNKLPDHVDAAGPWINHTGEQGSVSHLNSETCFTMSQDGENKRQVSRDKGKCVWRSNIHAHLAGNLTETESKLSRSQRRTKQL